MKVDQKPIQTIFCLQESHLKYKDTCRLKVNGWRKIYHANSNQNKSGVAILISLRADFKARITKLYMSILPRDITILNIHVPKNRLSNYVRQKLIECNRKIDESTTIVGDFNIFATAMNRLSS